MITIPERSVEIEMSDFRTIEAHNLESGISECIEILISRVVPDHHEQGIGFNEIRFEIWEDSGRVIAFPAQLPMKERIEKSGVQIVSKALANRVHDLDQSNLDDGEYEEELGKIVMEAASLVERVSAKKKLSPIGIYDHDGGRINRPNKSVDTTPASAPR